MEKIIDTPVGVKDSELKGWEYTIPEGMEAVIKDGKIIVREKESRDEKMRKWLINYFEKINNEIVEEDRQKIIAYLKEQKSLSTEETELNSLAFLEQMGYTCVPPGKEQKSAEWSEEDEKMLQRIIRHTESEYQDWCNDKYGNSEIVSDGKRSCLERLDWLENRLKSLRPQPHWKPEGQQLDCLRHMINVSTVEKIDKQLVRDLHEQLKLL